MKLPSSLIRYLVAGGTAFTIEYASFYILFAVLGAGVLMANAISFCAGLITSFLMNRLWSFKNSRFQKKAHHQALLYGGLAAINLAITSVVINFLSNLGLDPRLGKIVVMGMIVVWNFFIFRFAIFNPSANPRDSDKD